MNLNVMSFNIRSASMPDTLNGWPARRQPLLDLLASENRDLLGIQEALRPQLDDIRDRLSHYNELGVGRDDGMEGGEYAAILYSTMRFRPEESGTFWFSDTPGLAGSKHWGNHQPRICTWVRLFDTSSRRHFYVYNIHLDHRSFRARRKSAILLSFRIRHRHPRDPAIVLGDFNSPQWGTPVRLITSAVSGAPDPYLPLVDTHREFNHRPVKGTLNLFITRIPLIRIDFILVPAVCRIDHAGTVDIRRGKRFLSDHYPVVARFTIPAIKPAIFSRYF